MLIPKPNSNLLIVLATLLFAAAIFLSAYTVGKINEKAKWRQRTTRLETQADSLLTQIRTRDRQVQQLTSNAELYVDLIRWQDTLIIQKQNQYKTIEDKLNEKKTDLAATPDDSLARLFAKRYPGAQGRKSGL